MSYDDDRPSSMAEWDAFEARLAGEQHPDRAWILSDRDVWYPNPYYHGPKQPHPEVYDAIDSDENLSDAEKHEAMRAWIEGGGSLGDGNKPSDDDDIPF
jgi:hypothetical protein